MKASTTAKACSHRSPDNASETKSIDYVSFAVEATGPITRATSATIRQRDLARGSCIVDPFGKFLAGPNFEGEAILTAEIDRSALARGKYDFDATGHYARPDVFRLIVDERRRSPVVTLTDEEPSRSARNSSEVAG